MRGVILELIASPPRRALQVLRGRLGDDRVQLFGDRLHVRVDREDAQDEIVALLNSAGHSAHRRARHHADARGRLHRVAGDAPERRERGWGPASIDIDP